MNDLPENPRQFAKMSKGNSSRLKSKMARAVLCAESGNQTWPACKNSEIILWQNVRIKNSFGQPNSHLGWATSTPFVSIFPDFHKPNLIFFCFIPIEIRTKEWLVWMGLNFFGYCGFQPKVTHPNHILGECITNII